MLQKIKEHMETSLKHIMFTSQLFGNPKFPKCLTLPGIKHLKIKFRFFSKYGGSDNSLPQDIHKQIKLWIIGTFGNLKNENPEVWKHSQIPRNQRYV